MCGELGIGTNAALGVALKKCHSSTTTMPLLIEKVGGTVHLALGYSHPESYPELRETQDTAQYEQHLLSLCNEGRISHSTRHIDIPKDLRDPHPGEALIIGKRAVAWRENHWTVV